MAIAPGGVEAWLLLDDPTTGLDPILSTTVDDEIEEAARSGAGDRCS